MTIAHDQKTTAYLHGMTERYYRYLPKFCRPNESHLYAGTMLEFATRANARMCSTSNPASNPPCKPRRLRTRVPASASSTSTSVRSVAGTATAATRANHRPADRPPRTRHRRHRREHGAGRRQRVPRDVPLEAEAERSSNGVLRAVVGGTHLHRARPPYFERTPDEEHLADIARESTGYTLTDGQLQWYRLVLVNECRGKKNSAHRSTRARHAKRS